MTTAPAPAPAPASPARPRLAHAVASEWTKLISVRSTVWTLGTMAFLVVAAGMLAVSLTRPEDYQRMPYTAPAMFGLLVGQLPVILLGVLSITSEHGTGLIRSTFTAAPDRLRVLTAKYLVFSGTAFLTVTGAVFLVAVTAAIVNGGAGAGPHSSSEWVRALAGCAYVTLLGVLGLAVGSLVRHSAGTIVLMLGLVTLPPVIGGMLSIWPALEPVGRVILLYNAPVALLQLFGVAGEGGEIRQTSDLAQIGLLLVVTAATMCASYWTVSRRDL
ncbi:ABC transporter permease [Streptomyces sp. BI20]|uniref:ABC transporter permease n=1 Tax=Streptomyces sp. BI20 TaxID=3403460 RepID=UPI003C717B0E